MRKITGFGLSILLILSSGYLFLEKPAYGNGDEISQSMYDSADTRSIEPLPIPMGTSTLNYVGVSQSTNDHFAWACDINDWPIPLTVGGNLNEKREASDSEYGCISNSDDIRFITLDPGWHDEIFIWCEFTINIAPELVDSIQLTWEGHIDSAQNLIISAWNFETNSWDDLISQYVYNTDENITYNITAPKASSYVGIIESGLNGIRWGCRSTGSDRRLEMDYAQAVIQYFSEDSIPSNYVSHSPIRIDSNTDFDSSHGVVNWATGDGSPSNPWIIENHSINGTGYGYGLYIGNTTDYFIIRDCFIYFANGLYSWPYFTESGIMLYNVKNGTVSNCTITFNERDGIFAFTSQYNFFEKNSAYCNRSYNISLYSSSQNEIINNTNIGRIYFTLSTDNIIYNNSISENSQILLETSSNHNNFTNNFLKNSYITIKSSQDSKICNNTIAQSLGAISIESGSSNSFIFNNTITDGKGIFISSSDNNDIIENIINISSTDGIYIEDSDNNYIENNEIDMCEDMGIKLVNSHFNTIYLNEITSDKSSSKSAIQVSDSNFTNINENDIAHYWRGVVFGGDSSNSTVLNNTISDILLYGTSFGSENTFVTVNNNTLTLIDYYGIYSSSDKGNFTMTNNKITDVEYGIYLWEQSNINISDNFIANASEKGIFLRNSNNGIIHNITILNNEVRNCNGNGISIESMVTGNYYSSIDQIEIIDNVISDNNVGINIYAQSPSPAYESYIFNINIADNTLTSNSEGMNLTAFDDGRIWNVNVTDNIINSNTNYGAFFAGVQTCNVSFNTISSNGNYGLGLNGIYNNITYNTVKQNGNNGIYLFGDSSYNQIESNIIESNLYCGIQLSGISGELTNNITIANNTVFSNLWYGIHLNEYSNYNQIDHNNFIDNANQAYDAGQNNAWDNGYPSGGNYWSDYNGVDFNSTPTQDVPPPDGIGDTPYSNIDGSTGSEDQYPLMDEVMPPFVISTTPSEGDVNIPLDTNITIIFSESMNTTVIPVLTQESGSIVSYVFSGWNTTNVGNDTAIWTHINWATDDTIQLKVSGYEDLDGYSGLAYSWMFKTKDTLPPFSLAKPLLFYWTNEPIITLSANATDSNSGVTNVTLWYRFSTDNSSWGSWQSFNRDDTVPWSWDFNFPAGEGYYEFFSIANDTAGNLEPMKSVAEALCGYETQPPISSVNLIAPYWWTTAPISINATAVDTGISGLANVSLWYRFSSDNNSWHVWKNYGILDFLPWEWTFNFSDGNGYYEFYTIAVDNANNTEIAPGTPDAIVAYDNTTPTSSVSVISPYWNNVSPITITANANDTTGSGIANVTLWYRYSQNNTIWSANTTFGIDSTEPWNWSFDFPDGEGYYEFYSVAIDTLNHTEAEPITPDTACAYDITFPEITDNSQATATTGDSYTFNAIVMDNLALSDIRVIYWFGTGSEINTTMTHTAGNNYEHGINIPLNSLETMHYRIVAVDSAGNWNSTAVKNEIINDNDNPVADAGSDQTVCEGTIVTFDGFNSTDNIGIVNYTWAFNDGSQDIILYGANPFHNFTIIGNYTVSLTVQDSADNSDTDTMVVTVLTDTDGDGIPDETDPDDDNDGVPDNEDDFPFDPDEWEDADGDGTGDNEDTDDDNDGFLDEWEIFLGTDPLDSTDMPLDTDGDGIPDGDANNTQSWMDTDDDGDNVSDDDDPAPLDPEITGEGNIGDYWWVILILVIVLVVITVVMYFFKRKSPPTQESQ